jgi:AcrR family transcriptional regulator
MAQRPKPQMRAAILAAAGREFSRVGFEKTTLATIARSADTSIGNLYKYFPDKQALMAATLPPELVRELKQLFRGRVEALGAARDVKRLKESHRYRQASEELWRSSFAHRDQLLFLLEHGAEAGHASFRPQLERHLVTLAVDYARRSYPSLRLTVARRRTLERIFRGYLAGLASILAEHGSEEATREATDLLVTYHLAGLQAFFRAEARENAA